MKKQSQSDLLLANIELLKVKRKQEADILKFQFHATYQSLHPLNLIKHYFDGKASKSDHLGSFSEKVVGILSGYISNKMVVGASKSLVRKSIGNVLQLVVATSLSNNPGAITKGISWVLQRIMPKKYSLKS